VKNKNAKTVWAKPRREYNQAYRLEAVRLWKQSGKSAEQIGVEIGVGALALYRWNQEVKKNKHPTPPLGVAAGPAADQLVQLQLENKRLRKENAILGEQCEILKKATGILSQRPPHGMPASND